MMIPNLKAQEPRRLKSFAVSPHFLSESIAKGWSFGDGDSVECVRGLPEGAVRIRSWYDSQHDEFVMVFEHPSFDEMTEGAVIPRGEVVFDFTAREPEPPE